MRSPLIREGRIRPEGKQVAAQREQASLNRSEQPPFCLMFKQGCIDVIEVPHQGGPLAPTLGEFFALIHVDGPAVSALGHHVERSLMLKKKGIGQMVILDQNEFGGGHHLPIPRNLHDRDVRVRLVRKPLFAEDEPFVAALPEEGVRPASIIRRQQLPQSGGLWMQQPLLVRLAVEQEPLPDKPLFRSSGEARVSLALDEERNKGLSGN